MMRINNNLMAMNAHRYLSNTGIRQSKSLEKISSGLRINSAADDAAGLAISEKMRAQISGLEQAETNAQNGISLIQTAEGALNETHSILQRMRQLAVDSSNDTNTNEDRLEIQEEIDELATEITRISGNTEFNTQKLLDGSFDAKFHIGANSGQDMSLQISDMSASELGVEGTEGFTHEMTTTTVTPTTPIANTGIVFGEEAGDYAYTASALDNSVVIDETSYDYVLKDEAGDVVAVSEKGEKYQFLQGASSEENLGSADLATGAVVDFGAKVTSGKVTVTTTVNTEDTPEITTISAKATEASVQLEEDVELKSGTYSVVGKEHGLLADDGTEVGLVNSNGDLVAIGTDDGTTQTFISFSNSETLFTISNSSANALEAGGEIKLDSDGGLNVSTQDAASDAVTVLDEAIATVSSERSKLGAYQNRLEHTINNLSTTTENLRTSESRIRDVDVAKEMMEFTKLNILSQASQSMLAQANQVPQGVLQLLG